MSEPDFFVRLPEVLKIAGGVHRNTVYRWVEEGKFPPYHRLSTRVVAWRQSDLNKWLADFDPQNQAS
jgi:predicted DNA-binding transcriptional regulator AlpA